MSSAFDNLKKSHMKYFTGILFAITISLLFAGTFTTHWLTNSIDVYIPTYESVILNTSETIYDNGNDLKSNITVVNEYNKTLEEKIYSETEEVVYSSTKIYYITLDEVVGGGFTATTYYNETIGYVLYNTSGLKDNKFENVSFAYKNLYKITSGGGGSIHIQKSPAPTNITNNLTNPPELYTKKNIKYTADLFSKPNKGKLIINYGILLIEYKFDKSVGFADQTTIWGNNVLYDTPNKTWSFTLLLVVSSCLMLGLNFLSIVYSFCVQEKSRVYSVAVIYTWMGVICLLFGILLFPFSWENLKTYHIGWWANIIPSEVDVDMVMNSSKEVMKNIIIDGNVTETSMCGDSGFYNPGNCSIGYSYVLIIISFAIALFGYNCLRFSLSKRYSKALDDDQEKTLFNHFKTNDTVDMEKGMLNTNTDTNSRCFSIDLDSSDSEYDNRNHNNICDDVL